MNHNEDLHLFDLIGIQAVNSFSNLNLKNYRLINILRLCTIAWSPLLGIYVENSQFGAIECNDII